MSFFSSIRRPATAIGLAILASGSLAACAEDIGPQAYPAYAVGSVARVDEGVIVASNPIQFRGGPENGAGTVLGGVTGGVIGSQFGGRGGDRALFGVLGAIGGAVAGNAIARSANDRPGVNYVIRLRRGGRQIQVAQADAYPIPTGTHVYVSYGDRVRVQPIGGYGPPAPPPPRYR